jgi:hypothetical protein
MGHTKSPSAALAALGGEQIAQAVGASIYAPDALPTQGHQVLFADRPATLIAGGMHALVASAAGFSVAAWDLPQPIKHDGSD